MDAIAINETTTIANILQNPEFSATCGATSGLHKHRVLAPYRTLERGLEKGDSIPFDDPKHDIAALTNDRSARRVVSQWRRAGVPPTDLLRLRTDLNAFMIAGTMASKVFNLRYREFFAPCIAIEDGAMRAQAQFGPAVYRSLPSILSTSLAAGFA